MNGFELYNNIKKIDNKVKVCFFSACEPSSESYKQLVSKYKQDNTRLFFIQKPISMHDMIEQIKSILNN
jgi:response regulator RpfG family c-di-GMP phosphodiesterase